MTKKLIIITDRIDTPNIETEVFGSEYQVRCLNGDLHENQIKTLSEADGLLVWHSEITEPILNELKLCKGIVRYGTGYDNIDVRHASRLKIPVCNTPDYGVDEVADSTCALILNAVRQIKYYEQILESRVGSWGFASSLGLPKTSNHTLGIVGCGRIGTAVALRMKSFGMKIGFFDPYVSSGYEKAIGVGRFDSLEDLVAESSIISFHTPLTSETHGIINKKFIQNLRRNTILINTSRGSIVSDLNDLVEGLRSKKILFLGLDVVPDESGDLSSKLFELWVSNEFSGRVSITPHCAYFSDSAFTEMRLKASSNLKGILEGRRPQNQLNSH